MRPDKRRDRNAENKARNANNRSRWRRRYRIIMAAGRDRLSESAAIREHIDRVTEESKHG